MAMAKPKKDVVWIVQDMKDNDGIRAFSSPDRAVELFKERLKTRFTTGTNNEIKVHGYPKEYYRAMEDLDYKDLKFYALEVL